MQCLICVPQKVPVCFLLVHLYTRRGNQLKAQYSGSWVYLNVCSFGSSARTLILSYIHLSGQAAVSNYDYHLFVQRDEHSFIVWLAPMCSSVVGHRIVCSSICLSVCLFFRRSLFELFVFFCRRAWSVSGWTSGIFYFWQHGQQFFSLWSSWDSFQHFVITAESLFDDDDGVAGAIIVIAGVLQLLLTTLVLQLQQLQLIL